MAMYRYDGKPFSHTSNNGVKFSSETSNLSNGVRAIVPPGLLIEKIMTDVAEMVASHMVHVREEISSFSGYDCIRFMVGDES